MKIAITGGNSGLGLELSRIWKKHGHAVVNFSRSNGHNINDVDGIVEAVKDFDVFINNAYSGFAQVDILYKLFDIWQGNQDKFIINVGTEQTNRWLQNKNNETTALPWKHGQRSFNYRTSKVALEDAQLFLSQQSDCPKMMMLKPAIMDTPRNQGFVPTDNDSRCKTDPVKVAQFVYDLWNNRQDFYVTEVALRPLEWY
jgi:hypothetical protein